MDAVLNDAAPMLKEFRKSSIMPEMVLLALLRRENTAAWRMLKMFETSRGVDLDRLERQVKAATQSRRDPDGSLDFVAIGNRKVSLSRQSIVLLDDGLTIANSMNEQKIDTDHALGRPRRDIGEHRRHPAPIQHHAEGDTRRLQRRQQDHPGARRQHDGGFRQAGETGLAARGAFPRRFCCAT